jgi:hypothetical protein
MKYLIMLFPILIQAQSTNLTVQGGLRVRGGNEYIGTDTTLHNVGLDVNPSNLQGNVQIGIYSEPIVNASATVGGVGIRVKPRTKADAGTIPYFHQMDIYPPVFGTGSRANDIVGLYINPIVGGLRTNTAIQVAGGLSYFNDTVWANKLAKFGGAMEFRGRVISSSQRLSDTDYIVLADVATSAVRCTLTTLAASISREYRFRQYSFTSAGNFVIYPSAGEKIETYDSICMRSNIGVSSVTLLNVSSKWIITEQHEEGLWSPSLTGVSGTVTDTGWYIRDRQDVFLRIKPLLGTSNSTSLGIGGLSTIFTTAGLDSTYTATQTAIGYNAGAKCAVACTLPMSGANIVCQNVSSGFAAWTNTGIKGVPYGLELRYHLPKQPSF